MFKKLRLQDLNPRHFGVKLKINLTLILSALISTFVIGIVGFNTSKYSIEEVVFDQLTSVREGKKRAIEDYFKQLHNYTISFSEDIMVIDAMREFDYAYGSYSIKDSNNNIYRSQLANYYNNDFADELKRRNLSSNNLFPNKPKTIHLQYLYTLNNINGSNEVHFYDKVHEKYHKVLFNMIDRFDLEDLYLIEPKNGDIIYSVKKGIDFATNLKYGTHSKSSLGRLYKSIAQSPSRTNGLLMDYKQYIPELGQPTSFIGTAIYGDNDKPMGYIILKLKAEKINEILTGNNNWENDGLGKTGQTYLVGDDHKMRSVHRFLIDNEDEYYLQLNKGKIPDEAQDKIRTYETSILFQSSQSPASDAALKGKSGKEILENFSGTKVLSAYAPLSVRGLNWGIVSEIYTTEAFIPIKLLRNKFIILVAIILAFLLIIGNLFAKLFTRPIYQMNKSINELSKGELPENLHKINNDELGDALDALNSLTERMKEASEFAVSVGEGKFESEFHAMSEKDSLGSSLTNMRDKLSEIAKSDERRNWHTRGIAEFAETLRNNNSNLSVLCEKIIIQLVKYLNSNQGAIFILEEDDQGEEILDLKAAYAWGRRKMIKSQLKLGEGQIGQCVVEKDIIHLTEIPDDFVNIRSGLGEANPNSILIVPLIINEEVHGAFEIASFHAFDETVIEFATKIAESIAATVANAKVSERTSRLLDESKEMTEAMRSQEEELRQNQEEMVATQEEMDRRNVELEEQVQELKRELNQLKGQ